MQFYTLAVSGADRVRAVHEDFAGRTTSDLLNVVAMLGIGAVVLFAILIIVNRIQEHGKRIKEARHRAEVEARLRRASEGRVRY